MILEPARAGLGMPSLLHNGFRLGPAWAGLSMPSLLYNGHLLCLGHPGQVFTVIMDTFISLDQPEQAFTDGAPLSLGQSLYCYNGYLYLVDGRRGPQSFIQVTHAVLYMAIFTFRDR